MPCYKRTLKKGIRWYYKFDYKGKTYSSEAKYLSKSEAKTAEAERYSEAEEIHRNPRGKKVYLFNAINKRLDYLSVKKSKSHYKSSRQYLKIILKYIQDIPLEEIKKVDIEDILLKESSLHKTKRGNGFYTINAMLRCYKSFFNFTIENHDIEMKNPCIGIKPYPIDKKMKYIPSNKDIEAVLSICDEEQKRFLQFLMDTGARLSEALNLRGQDVADEYVILYTRKSKDSNLIPRKVPKPDCLKGLKFQDDERIFARWDGKPKFLQRKIKSLGIRQWGYHSLRHRRASLWSKEGMPLFNLMSLLGHSNLETTQLYLQLLP